MNNQTIGKLRIETLLQELQPFFFYQVRQGRPPKWPAVYSSSSTN